MNRRHVPILVFVALVAATLACGQAETSEPTAVATSTLFPEPLGPEQPTRIPEPAPSGDYDGAWLGITSQGLPITVTVRADVITELAFDVMVIGDGWTATTEQYHPVAISIVGGQADAVRDFAEWHVEFSGVFNEDVLSGELGVEHIHPQGFGWARVDAEFRAVRLIFETGTL